MKLRNVRRRQWARYVQKIGGQPLLYPPPKRRERRVTGEPAYGHVATVFKRMSTPR